MKNCELKYNCYINIKSGIKKRVFSSWFFSNMLSIQSPGKIQKILMLRLHPRSVRSESLELEPQDQYLFLF